MSVTPPTWISYYASFYAQYAMEAWDTMTPSQYGSLLICVALFGWILMKSGMKR